MCCGMLLICYATHCTTLTLGKHFFGCYCMFNWGFPEKVIAETSVHRNTKALLCYERTSEEFQQAVTKVINNPANLAIPECKVFTFQHSSQSNNVT